MGISEPGSTAPIALWGGVECTVNRVGDRYFCQLRGTGHDTRLDDLDLFATLGIRAIRYPVLWERTAPQGLHVVDWSWADTRLARLQALDIEPIVGLVHHGSGPPSTSLIDPAFPEMLAQYAGAVAERYPWIEYYTPVNEPLTTARFSGLYGHWYPHGRDVNTFVRALLIQCRAVIQSMQAIRRINPSAKLVQTDDLGRTYSTLPLQYQAQFQNELRWLAWDLLCGRVDRHHPLWHWMTRHAGLPEHEVLSFGDPTCPPDIVGVNYYVTSDRMLDDRLELYPAPCHGGNGRHRYADTEAARAIAAPVVGIGPLLKQAWERYRLPVAVTEAHIDAGREDQLRWLAEIWQAADRARADGADIRAVTVWALLGSHDWNCLLTECRGYYESGAFDVRSQRPRPTAIAALMRELAIGHSASHPVLAGPGWWQRPERFICPPVPIASPMNDAPKPELPEARPILITGGTGMLANAVHRLCRQRGLASRLLARDALDIADPGSVERALDRYQPWAIVNAAGYVRVDDAESQVDRCYRDNTLGPQVMASACARHGIQLLTFSSDLVFDGRRQSPYVEADLPAPLNVYGMSKARAEAAVLDRQPDALVVRTSSLFGPWDQSNFVSELLRALSAGRPFAAANDLTVSPTYIPDLVQVCLDLLIDGESGIWHLSNGHAITWADFAMSAATMAGVDSGQLEARGSAELSFIAQRPLYSALASERAILLPSLDNALRRYIGDHERTKGQVGGRG